MPWLSTALGALGGIPSLVASVFNYMTGRSTLNNTPDMQRAEKAKKDVETDEKLDKDIMNKDVAATQKDLE